MRRVNPLLPSVHLLLHNHPTSSTSTPFSRPLASLLCNTPSLNMSDTMLQYQAVKQGGPFTLVTVPRPKPDPTDVCIRTKAVALNPLDFKMLTRGEMVRSWPAVFGLDGAGVVEEVGDEVTDFKPGQEVFALCGIGGKTAGFQQVVTVPQHFVSQKPASLSFEQVASLP